MVYLSQPANNLIVSFAAWLDPSVRPETGLIFAYVHLWKEVIDGQQPKAIYPAFILSEALQGSLVMSAIACLGALRVIGHDLEIRSVKTFVVRCETDLYVVEVGYQSPPAPTPVILHYTLDDIEQLDREGRKEDDCDSGVKDFLRLSQILPAVGTYVVGRGARLLSVSNTASTAGTMWVVTIEYETAQGERVVDSHSAFAIYDMCVRFHKLRERFNAYPLSS